MKNNKLMSLALSIMLLQINGQGYAQTENNDNKKLVETWFTTIARHDTVALAALYADTALVESPNWEGTKRGPSAVREIYSRYFTTSPDLTHTVINIFTNEKTAVVEYIFAGTMTNLEKSSPEYMRGKKYALKACMRMNIRLGKITGQAFYFDQVAFLRQVGFFEQK